MARSTPRVEQDILLVPVAGNGPIPVGSRQWFSWLADDDNSSFFFTHEAGSFTARKERRKRGGWYWIAYRSRGGKLAKTYIGRPEDLTTERLHEVASLLTEQQEAGDLPSIPAVQSGSARFAPPPLYARSGKLLERNALLARLDECLHVKLMLVTAPAGFGKTTLLSQWYETGRQRHKHTFAWITLNEQDNDPIRFWSAVWRALRGEKGGAALDFALPLSSTPQMSIETVLASLVSAGQRCVLILDDYHAITNEQVHAGMEFLLAHQPPDLHLVIASRSEPPLALGRARMYGELRELRADDLRLSHDEIARFLRDTIGITLSADEQNLLEQRTEGWIAGLSLVGLALREQQKPGELLTRFTGSQRSLFDYFAEEVFAQQPPAVQRFLLYTAPLRELTPSLCEAMLADASPSENEVSARGLLDYLERANAFVVPLDEQRRCYRYHALFSEFLREKLRQSHPALETTLHQRAACWYEQQGCFEDAIDYALEARDSARAARLIEHIGEEILWRKGQVKYLLAWIQKLPATSIEERGHLALLATWAQLLGGQRDLEEIEVQVEAIERRNGESLRGELLALRARIAAFRNETEQSMALARQALQVLPRERALLRADVAFGMSGSRDPDEAYRMLAQALHISQALGSLRTAMFASRYLAANCLEQGRLTEAEAILRQALRIAGTDKDDPHPSPQEPATGVIHIGLAELLYERNELSVALRHARRGIELGESSGEIKVLLSGRCILALIHAALGEYEQGWQELWKAERLAALSNVPWLRENMAACAVRLALRQNDLLQYPGAGQNKEGVINAPQPATRRGSLYQSKPHTANDFAPGAARRALHTIGIDADAGLDQAPAADRVVERLMLADVWLATGKDRAVVELLAPLVEAARQGIRIKAGMAALVRQAIALNNLRERQRATRALSEALNMAGPEGYLRTLLDAGEPLLTLLRTTELTGSAKGYARQLLAASGEDGAIHERPGGLSEREYEVLRQLATGQSNQEIAETLVVATSTIKAHVRHICQKLGVQNRLQAVTRAKALGIL